MARTKLDGTRPGGHGECGSGGKDWMPASEARQVGQECRRETRGGRHCLALVCICSVLSREIWKGAVTLHG